MQRSAHLQFIFARAMYVGRDYEPTVGQWYEDLDEKESFLVRSVNEDDALVEIEYSDGEIEEIDLDTWAELDLNLSTEPEGWVGSGDDDDDDDDDWDEDEDEDEDEDDDWDDDEDDDDEDEDDEERGDY